MCLDSKRQKATKKMWVFIVLGTTGETCEIFPGSLEKKANKIYGFAILYNMKRTCCLGKVLKCTVNIFLFNCL